MFDFDNAGVDFGDITMDAEGVFTGVGYAGSMADIIALHYSRSLHDGSCIRTEASDTYQDR